MGQRYLPVACLKALFGWGLLLGAALVLGLFSPLEKTPWLACVLLAPLIHMLNHGGRTGILKGLMAGWIFGTLSWAFGTFWLLNAMESLMDLAFWQSSLSLAGIWLYQGSPFALFGALCGWMNRKGAPAGPLFCASLLTLLLYLRPVLFPVSWTVAVTFWPGFIQIADLGGELLVCFCLIWVNGLVADVFSGMRQRKVKNFAVSFISLFILLALVLGYGVWRIAMLNGEEREAVGRSIRVASVQPNVPVRWDSKNIVNFKTDETLCLEALTRNPDLVRDADLLLFPELPRMDCRSEEFEKSGLRAALEHLRIPVLMHGKEEIPAPEAPVIHRLEAEDRSIVEEKLEARYSAVFALDHGKECALVYRKRIPVPFSETSLYSYFFPERIQKPGLKLWLSRGSKPGLIPVGDFSVQPMICFESGFPELVREGVGLGANLLVELSNDGWFFSSRAEKKHLGMAVFRAVEFRRPLVRSSNSGGGAHVRATGEIVEGTLTPHDTVWVTQEALFCPDVSTLFARRGYVWLWGAVLIVCWHMRSALGRGRKALSCRV
ncbi:apolipoprotein N-acyltransferase [Desulfobotulus alkaliphilus]|uniref:Apolipoprotein N-acyltransferase n=1 Tax=Desulfobotulus alkaliphilus TaxID=622671 RepID=A0A562RTA9_9BACT|nr:apolipoprotein N-acyltransferase [Desulfobotulus alkaliphilus]TWI72282.1 apolipoprotein N-acyltransferase [Desulfobotulus alkaliphilus]